MNAAATVERNRLGTMQPFKIRESGVLPEMPHRLLTAAFLLSASALLAAQSAPSFELNRDTTTINNAGTIVQGDFNGDGKPDLVTGGGPASQNQLTLRLGNGDGTFQAPTVIGTAGDSQIRDLLAADINNDGKLDLVASIYGTGFEVFYGNGDGTFQPGVLVDVPNGPEGIAAGDFNGDGLLDIAVGDDQGDVEIWTNEGGKSFAQSATYNLNGGLLHIDKVRAGSIDGDGIIDLAAISSNTAYLLWNDGKGNFTTTTLNVYPGISDLNVEDLNQDGMDDVIVAYGCDSSGSENCQGIDVWYGQGDEKTFYRHAVTVYNVYLSQIWGVDVNGDGIGDLVAASPGAGQNQETVYVFTGNPDGSFSQTPLSYVTATLPTGYPSGEYTSSAMVPGDWNRDGMIDFAVTLPPVSQAEILINGGNRAPCATSQISPAVTVCQPVNGTYLPSPVTVEANAYDKNTVTAMQEYIDGNLDYSEDVTSFTKSFTLGLGPHLLVTKAWDATGLSFRSDRDITVYSGSPYPACAAAYQSASICLPSGTSSASPVHILANGWSPAAPTAAQLYIDGDLVINTDNCSDSDCQGGTSYVDTTQSLSSGTHDLVFKLWDAAGNVYEAQKTITVN